MSNWIDFKQYPGFSILDDASKIRTPDGEFALTPGKLFYFNNPNTGTKNFAKPEVLLQRAKQGDRSFIKKEPADPSAPKKYKTKSERKEAQEKKRQAKLEKEREKQSKKEKKEDAKRKKEQAKEALKLKKLRNTKRKVQLLPDEVAHQYRVYLDQQKRLDAGEKSTDDVFLRGLSGMFFYFNRSDEVRTIFFNSSKDLVLVRVDGPQDWRAGRWFYNPETEKFTEFVLEKHKLGPGNDKIVWPEDLGGEHLFGPDYVYGSHRHHPKLKSKKEKATEEDAEI